MGFLNEYNNFLDKQAERNKKANEEAAKNLPWALLLFADLMAALLTIFMASEEKINIVMLIYVIICALITILYVWFITIPKLLLANGLVKEVPNCFRVDKKSKTDVIMDKTEGAYLGYEETVDGMYSEHYEAMVLFNNIKFYLEENSKDLEFHLGDTICKRFAGNIHPQWHEAFFLHGMDGSIIYMIYNDGKRVYTFKNGKWYVNKLPGDQQEPDLTRL